MSEQAGKDVAQYSYTRVISWSLVNQQRADLTGRRILPSESRACSTSRLATTAPTSLNLSQKQAFILINK